MKRLMVVAVAVAAAACAGRTAVGVIDSSVMEPDPDEPTALGVTPTDVANQLIGAPTTWEFEGDEVGVSCVPLPNGDMMPVIETGGQRLLPQALERLMMGALDEADPETLGRMEQLQAIIRREGLDYGDIPMQVADRSIEICYAAR